MGTDGKMPALNTAVRETIPHLRSVAAQNPHAELLVRALAFSTGAHWHVAEPMPAERLVWTDLVADGLSDLGAALLEVARQLATPPMPARALPPAIVLISDGLPTDDWEAGLAALMATPWGARSIRLAIGIGRDADHEVLERFIATEGVQPMHASNPEQLLRMLRWATVHAGRLASTAAKGEPPPYVVPGISEVVW